MSAPAGLPALPKSLKQVQHYLKTAIEHDKRDPVIAYYCRLYSMQTAMAIDKSSPEARQFLLTMMDYLEKTKSQLTEEEAIHNQVIGQAHVENYALKMFLYADNEDRAGRFNKNVVKSFYTAGMLLDVLSTFGELSEDLEKNKKYAKWKAAYIHKCLKSGETPIAGPLPGEGDEDGAVEGNATGEPGFSSDHLAPSVPPSNMTSSQDSNNFPAYGSHAPPTTPMDPTRGDYPPPAAHQNPPTYNPQPMPRGSTAAQPSTAPEWVPPPNPSGVTLTAEQYQKGIKFCKYASSAMQYEDSATAIDNLTKALRLLTTGREK